MTTIWFGFGEHFGATIALQTKKPTSGLTLPILRADLDERKLETKKKYQHHLKKQTRITFSLLGLTDKPSTVMSTILLLIYNIFHKCWVTLSNVCNLT